MTLILYVVGLSCLCVVRENEKDERLNERALFEYLPSRRRQEGGFSLVT